ncbi:hypothetical protein [Streptomyces sp. TBY4]|uniref:hypothetical protein n=1 Tax=Streptomyces sp. TBY4 TaxID=2962030 RepID=UPI0020B81325|nr:hypothetical protein [Streptomyces sp. TBY4]MCP3759998.1 hypothetical protein [Streptomyces sp. TBY4]
MARARRWGRLWWSRWWILIAGIAISALGVAAYEATPYPELRTIQLFVLSESPDGRCEVRWYDVYASRMREGAYRCDPDRAVSLKPSGHHPETDYGYDYGWLRTEDSRKGDLYVPEDYEDTGAAFGDYLLPAGVFVMYIGLLSAGVPVRLRLRLGRRRPGGGAPAQG